MKKAIKTLTPLSIVLFFLPFFQMCSAEHLANNPGENPILSGFEMALAGVEDFDLFSDPSSSPYLIFTLIVLLTFVSVFLAFREKFLGLTITTSIILSLSVLSMLLLYVAGSLTDIDQIKYGYYLFVLNESAILYLTYRHIKISKTTHNTSPDFR